MKKILLFCCAAIILCACKKDPKNEPTDYGQRINNPVDTTATTPSTPTIPANWNKAYVKGFAFYKVPCSGYYKVAFSAYDLWGAKEIDYNTGSYTPFSKSEMPRYIYPDEPIYLGEKLALDYYDHFTVSVYEKSSESSSTYTLCIMKDFAPDLYSDPQTEYRLLSNDGKTDVGVLMKYE